MTMEKGFEPSGSLRRACPDELAGPVPRNVRLDSSNAGFVVFAVLFCFAWGIVICGFHGWGAVKQMRQREILRRDGREVLGEVTTESNHRGAPASVSYKFSVDGATYLGNAQMPVFKRVILHKSDPIAIRFLPSNPVINHPESWEWSVLGEIDMAEILMPFLFVAGAVALMLLRRDRKLAREGKVAEGVVIGCTPDKAEFRVKYEFRTDNGVTIRGSCDAAEEYEKGANIWILYLPEMPRRNHSYPTGLFTVVE